MIEITSLTDLQKIVLDKDLRNQIIIIKFGSNDCTSCTILTPELEKLEYAFGNRVLVVEIDVNKAFEIAKAFQIEGIPTGIFYYKNRMFKELTLVGGTIGQYYQNVNVLLSQYNV